MKPMPRKAVAKLFNVSQERVKQIERKFERGLRTLLSNHGAGSAGRKRRSCNEVDRRV